MQVRGACDVFNIYFNDLSVTNDYKLFQCAIHDCEPYFREHLSVHTRENPYSSANCRFKDLAIICDISKHTNTHTGDYPYT